MGSWVGPGLCKLTNSVLAFFIVTQLNLTQNILPYGKRGEIKTIAVLSCFELIADTVLNGLTG